MNPDQPPLSFPDPQIEARRAARVYVPLPAARVALRGETARVLGEMASKVDSQLKTLSPEQRQQVLIKVEHERPVDLGGTGLKLLGPQGEHVSLAVLKPGEEDLGKLQQKLKEFGTGPLDRGQPKHTQLDGIQKIESGKPTDRLSDGLFAVYPELTASKAQVVVEIEMPSLLDGTVRCNGELLTSGSVVLWNERGPVNYSIVFPNGKYRVSFAPRGRVRVTVSSRPYPPAELLPKPGEPWPAWLMRSPELPVDADDSESQAVRENQPPPLPKPTAAMQALLAKVEEKYGLPAGSDGFYANVSSGTQTYDIELTVP